MKHLARVWTSILLAALLLTAGLSGCTPHRELRELAIVEGIGVDQNTDGSYFVTFQIYKPSSSGGSSDKGGTSEQTTIVQGSGVSMFDASRNVTLQMGKKLYYANCNIFILGREVCQTGMFQIIDFLNRNHEINAKQRVFMSATKASDILTTQQSGKYIPAHDLRLLSENYYNTSQMVDQQLGDLNDHLNGGITAPFLGVLQVEQAGTSNAGQSPTGGQSSSSQSSSSQSSSSQSSSSQSKSGQSSSSQSSSGQSSSSQSSSGQSSSSQSSSSQSSSSQNSGGGQSADQIVRAEGTAIFSRQGKLLGVMDKNATRGLLWIDDSVRSGVINVSAPEFGQASLEIRKASSTVRVVSRQGKPVIQVSVKFFTGLTEVRLPAGRSLDTATIRKIVVMQNGAVRGEIESALQFALRQQNADIFGFGQKIYEFQPKTWRLLSKSWDTMAGQTDVEVSVNSEINHSGLIF